MSGHMAQDYEPMCISIPPKYAVAEVLGYLKEKSAIAVARQFGGKMKNFSGENLWARGDAVATAGFELAKVKECIARQKKAKSGTVYRIQKNVMNNGVPYNKN